MRVFKTRVFDRWAGKAGVTDTAQIETALKTNELMEVQHEPND